MDSDKKTYTASQELAIKENGKTILVSAAAGSGKTFVLTERIIARITDKTNPVSIDELLVVTFTNAAAAEIKQRLSSALSELIAENPGNRALIKQLALVGSSHIQTNDAFFLSVIKEHFDKANLPAGFTVCGDENITNELSKKACNNVLERHYASEKDGSRFFKVIENFSKARDDENVAEFLYKLYKQLIKLENPIEFLENSIDEYNEIASGALDFFDSSWGKAAANELEFEFEHYTRLLDNRMEALDSDETCPGYRDALEYYKDFINKLREAVRRKNYGEAYNTIITLESTKLNKKGKGELSALGDAIKEDKRILVGSLKDGAIRAMLPCDENTLKAICSQCAEIISGIKELFCEFESEYAKLKDERSIIDFSDISRKCYDLLIKDGKPTEIAESTAAKFREIYIDEYQDTNKLQDTIFRTLSECSGAPRFMVGDVKQCIYAFRDSDPKLFKGYYDSFPDADKAADENCEKILLSENFRCDLSVVNTVNLVFENLMSDTVGGIKYNDGAKLIFGKDKSKTANKSAEIIITESGGNVKEKAEAEAKNCAAYIAKLIREEGYQPSDFAVLFRKRKRLSIFRKAIAELGIPINDEEGDDISSLAEIELVMAVLSAIDDPASDIPLAAAMCSPVFGFDYDELSEYSFGRSGSLLDSVKGYAENGDEKAKEFLAKLSDYRKYSLSFGIDKLIQKICSDGSLDLTIKSMPDGKTHYANILALCQAARAFSNSGLGGISEFISYVKDGKIKASAASGNGVTLTTIHKSKGLEYKVCILVSAHEELISSSGKNDFYDAKGVSASFSLMHSSGYAKLVTPMSSVAKRLEAREPINEALRVLYVGMTRAKERLIISAAESSEKLRKTAEGFAYNYDICGPYYIRKASSTLEWLMRAISKKLGADKLCAAVDDGDAKLTDDLDLRVVSSLEEEAIGTASSEEIPLEIKVYPDYTYPHSDRRTIRAKLSVSDLKKSEDTEQASEKSGSSIFSEQSQLRPEFMKKDSMSAAEKGTAMHVFMQFCDFELARKNISDEADRMEKLGFITKEQRAHLDEKKLSEFFGTELYSKIKSAKKIYREQRYNLADSADKYYESADKNETVLVQGVIDLFFETEDGKIILADFKTDRVKEDGGAQLLINRHSFQLSMYKRAIEKMLKKPLDAAYIYSFSLGAEIPVPL